MGSDINIQALDFPAVMGFAVVVSFAYVLVNPGSGFALFVD